MNTPRANPFADVEQLPTFVPKPRATKPATEQIDAVADANGFPSRQAPRASASRKRGGRRYRTGRNQQINIKATQEVIERLYKMADARRVPLGELLEHALDALERSARA